MENLNLNEMEPQVAPEVEAPVEAAPVEVAPAEAAPVEAAPAEVAPEVEAPVEGEVCACAEAPVCAEAVPQQCEAGGEVEMPAEVVAPKKKLIKKWWFWAAVGAVILALVGVIALSSSGSSGSSGGGSYYTPDPYVELVKTATNSTYGITYGDAFDDFFGSPKWSHFEATTGEHVVEFEGEFSYADAPATALVQFVLDLDEGMLEVYYLEINGEAQNRLMLSALLEAVFESYY